MSDLVMLTKQNLSDQAKHAIKRSLMTGAFKPGERLLLRRLADELGISVTPVREALLQLVSEQALVMDENRTVTVPVLTIEHFVEVTDLRLDLETRAAESATAIITAAQIDALEALHLELEESKKGNDFRATCAANENFHFALYRASAKPVLYRLIEILWVQIGPVLNRLYDPPLPSNERHGHLDIIKGLRSRDAKLVCDGLRHDLTENAEILRKRIVDGTIA